MNGSANHPYCECLFFSVGALHRKLGVMADEAFSRAGLAPSYGFLLMTVNRNPGISAGELARTMILSPSTLTRLVDKMVREGYIIRRKEGKYRYLSPTDKSTALQQTLLDSWQELFENYTGILGDDESIRLTSAVYRSVEALD